ncbi:MAG: hypothetical protein K8R21_11540 [Leptospira sp.]|nr:hypothetical protein [Leptospira sp.]
MGKINFLALLIFAVAILANCSSAPDYKAFNKNLNNLANEAKSLAKTGRPEEAAKIMALIYQMHPDDPIVKEILTSLSPEQREAISESSLLGFNKAKRAKVEPSTLERVLWYLPDRIFDLIDMFTIEVNLGPQIGGGVWVTRAVQVVAFTGTTGGGGLYQKKQYGLRIEASFELMLGPVGISAVSGIRGGTGGIDYTARSTFLHTPSKPIYQEYRDYWAIGAKAGLVIIGAEVELHPLEIFDFFAGIALFDPMGDDYATTRALQFSSEQKKNLEDAVESIRKMGEEGQAEYKKQFSKLNIEDRPLLPQSREPIGEVKGKDKKKK